MVWGYRWGIYRGRSGGGGGGHGASGRTFFRKRLLGVPLSLLLAHKLGTSRMEVGKLGTSKMEVGLGGGPGRGCEVPDLTSPTV